MKARDTQAGCDAKGVPEPSAMQSTAAGKGRSATQVCRPLSWRNQVISSAGKLRDAPLTSMPAATATLALLEWQSLRTMLNRGEHQE